MPNKSDADLIILGAGCAGLALARQLGRHRGIRVLLIEPRTRFEDDRTWCFWRPDDHDLRHLISASWSRWRLSSGAHAVVHEGKRSRYQMIRALDYYEDALAAIEAAPNVTLRRGLSATDVRDGVGGVEVHAGPEVFNARYCVDTRPPARPDAALWQVFSGALVDSETDMFDPSVVGLMDDMRADGDGFRFVYTLPITPRRALIETTRFASRRLSPMALDNELDRDIQSSLGGAPVQVVRRERAILPMGLDLAEAPRSGSVFRAGLSGGALRASTGYGFLNIQAWASVAATRIAAGLPPVAPATRPIESTMDAVFLRALTANPERAASWFLAMADALGAERFARFMSDDASIGDWAQVIAALPKSSFIRALFQSPGPQPGIDNGARI